ncbi:hypothetical protein THAOC_22678 [Thalassiosira oceanica]|uniref:Uncharacterized protein n=1 Tax=Thalassiosira oceanica TaxID=159749 RepID=K0RTX9_THAOC|nr:hypothetical protein THAOC_22678 [Thalassiosira oceanica]|eukprot:EJK57293.1 hypothetical protein THAOC_22678 [Thalassiosira oceanica]
MLSPRIAGVSESSEGTVPRRQLRGRRRPVQLMSVAVHGSFSTNVDMCALEENRRDRFVYGVRVALADTACGDDNQGCQAVTPHNCDETHTRTRRMQISTQQGMYSVVPVFNVSFVVTSSVVCQSQNCQGEQDVERSSTTKDHMERNLQWSFHMHAFEEALRDVIGDMEGWGDNLVVEGETTGLQKSDLNDSGSNTSSASLFAKSAQGGSQSKTADASGQYFPRMNGPRAECISVVNESPDEMVVKAGFVYDTYEECCEEFNCDELTTTSSTCASFPSQMSLLDSRDSSIGLTRSALRNSRAKKFRCLRYERQSCTYVQETQDQLMIRQSTSTALSANKYFPDTVTASGCTFGIPDDFVSKAGFVYDTYEVSAFMVFHMTLFQRAALSMAHMRIAAKYFLAMHKRWSPAKRPTQPEEIVNVIHVMEGPVTTTQTTPVANSQAPIRSPAKRPTQPVEILNVIHVTEGPVTTTQATIATSHGESLLEQSDPGEKRDPFAQTTTVAAQPEGIATDVQSGAQLIATTSQPTATTVTTQSKASTTTSQSTATTETMQEFYPDLIHGSGKCMNDSKAPAFTRNNGHVYDELVTCCKKHYDYSDESFFNCMINQQKGSGLWFVDYKLERCVKDCLPHERGSPACAMDPPGRYAEVFGDPELCCSRKFNWIPIDHCMGRSFVGIKITTEATSNAAPEEYPDSEGPQAGDQQFQVANVQGGATSNAETEEYANSASTLPLKWYPAMDEEYKCKRNTPPTWMTESGYRDLYIFESKGECCAVYRC